MPARAYPEVSTQELLEKIEALEPISWGFVGTEIAIVNAGSKDWTVELVEAGKKRINWKPERLNEKSVVLCTAFSASEDVTCSITAITKTHFDVVTFIKGVAANSGVCFFVKG